VRVPVAMAFAAGIRSRLSPCIIPMISVYLTLITGTTLEEFTADQAGWRRSTIMVNTLLLVFDFTVVFVLAGAATKHSHYQKGSIVA